MRLPRTLPLGIGEQEAQTIQQTWNTAEFVEEHDIENYGLRDYSQPKYVCPELTEEMLTTEDSRSYTEVYARLLGWFNYTSGLLAKTQARVMQYSNMQGILEAQTRKRQRELARATGTKITAEELNDLLLTNPEYQEITLQLQRYKQAKVYLDAKVDSLERSLRVISRQVEIKKLDFEQTRNASNMPNRGEYPTVGRDRR